MVKRRWSWGQGAMGALCLAATIACSSGDEGAGDQTSDDSDSGGSANVDTSTDSTGDPGETGGNSGDGDSAGDGDGDGSGGRSSGGQSPGAGGQVSPGAGGNTGSGGAVSSGERALGSSDGDGTGCEPGVEVDACGICGGDGSACDCVEGQLCWDIVFEHNEVRRQVNLGQFAEQPAADPPIAMVGWDPMIAAKAQEYATSMDDWADGHSSAQFRTYQSTHHDGYHGENMAIGGGQYADPHEFVYNMWCLDEAQDCQLSGCGGHYTQVVWRESEWIGCGRKDDVPFESGGMTYMGTLTVCQYGPGGNSGGEPY